MRRNVLSSLAIVAVLTATGEASAATYLTGGSTGASATWTLAGSPYIVQGDLVVPSLGALTIEAGVEVRFDGGDLQATGRDTARSELSVRGSLRVMGTADAPVVFRSNTGTTAGTWYGLVVESDAAEAELAHARVSHARYGVLSMGPATVTSLTDIVVSDCSEYGLYIESGTPVITGLEATRAPYGVYVAGTAAATIESARIHATSSYGVFVSATAETPADTVIAQSTIHNAGTGVYFSSSTGARSVFVRDSILTSSGYGARRASSGSLVVSNTNAWGNSTDLQSATTGAGIISANPLYVSPSNLRITSNSPCRFAGSSGQDIGVLPYAGDPTPGLYGVLWDGATLTAAGSPYTASGDLTVPAGETLTVEAGARVNFTGSDIMASGLDRARGELLVGGDLVVAGVRGTPSTLSSSVTPAGSWYGVRLLEGSTARVEHAVIERARVGIHHGTTGPTQIADIAVRDCSEYGVYVAAGGPRIDAPTITRTSYGVYVAASAAVTLVNALIHDQSSYGVFVSATSETPADTTIHSSTIHDTGTGVYFSSSTGARSVHVRNSLLTGSGYGARRASSGTLSVAYTDAWGNSTNLQSATTGAGVISVNPQYVGGGDFRLTGTSLAIDAGDAEGAPDRDIDGTARPLDGDGLSGAGHDLGAHEFVLTAECGNGVVELEEACDDGAANGGYGACREDCSGEGPYCGDGAVDGPETCDDANGDETDACPGTCEVASCGDGFVNAGVEACDDGNNEDGDGCPSTCRLAECGDGSVDGDEECDDGNRVDGDDCTNVCVWAYCGDGIVNAGVEACDDGDADDTDACLTDCAEASCGDGVVRSGVEACDDGNDVDTDGCRNDCAVPSCGDGIVQAGEACDDGNESNLDGCLGTCRFPSCGDGFRYVGVEACDDGNGSDADGCLSDCTAAACGDGFVHDGVEECDDANDDDHDACPAGCVAAYCGDGFVRAGIEGCDDGNSESADGCSEECVVEDVEPGDPEPDAGDTSADAPTDTPTDTPTDAPTDTPTDVPTDAPTDVPTDAPTDTPTDARTDAPADAATEVDTGSEGSVDVSDDSSDGGGDWPSLAADDGAGCACSSRGGTRPNAGWLAGAVLLVGVARRRSPRAPSAH